MELKCVVLVTLVSLGAATPHGYGVKGGNLATAQSSASSGVIGSTGGFPAAIPLGASFAGSYSKSSASSHSASSASSSSSSFSYSGSGAGSYSGFGSNGIPGCGTGDCKNAPNGLSGSHGANSATQGYSAANSASSAGSYVGSPGCQGSDCQIDTNKCITGECKPNTDTEATSIDSASNGKTGCTSGQCGSTHNSGASSVSYDANDIQVGNSKHQASDARCLNGNCGTTSGSAKPGYSQYGSNKDQSSSTSNTQHTANSEYPKPSTELESPKIHSLPSSYNVPIHGSYDYNEPQPSCKGNECAQKGSHSTSNSVTSTNYLSPPAITSPSGTNCAGTNCGTSHPANFGANVGLNSQTNYGKPIDNTKPSNDDTPKYSGGFGGPAGLFKPNEFNAPSTTTTSLNQPHLSTSSLTKPSPAVGCTSSACAPDANEKPEHQATYTGGFGGPTGVLKPNEQNNYTNKPTSPQYNTNIPSSNVSPTGCNSPNCHGYAPTAGSTPEHSFPTQSLSTSKPINSVSPSKDDLPPYVGGFGGPSGILKPNEFDVHSQVPPSGHNLGACKTANCLPPVHEPQTESFAATKPIVGPHISIATSPSYTSHHDTSSGVSKINDISSAITSISPSYTQSPISTGSYSTGCKSGNCGDYPTQTAPASAAGPYGPSASSIKPSTHTGCTTGNCNYYPTASASDTGHLPSGPYNNGSPNAGKYPQVPESGYISGCTTGNCGNVPSTNSPNVGNYPTASTGCKSGNCYNYPSTSVTTTGNSPSGSYFSSSPNTSKYPQAPESGCKSANCGDSPSTDSLNVGKYPSLSTGCKTGNCGNYPTSNVPSSYNSPSESFDTANAGKFPASSTNIHSTGCITGNCGVNPDRPHVPSATLTAPTKNSGDYPSAPVNNYSPGCKTGNCHKLPAFNSHYEGHLPSGSLDVTATDADKHISTPGYTTDCKTGNCNNYPTSGIQPVAVGSVSQSNSVSSTHPKPTDSSKDNLPAYHGGFGGAPGLLKPNEYTVPVAGHKPTATPPKSSSCSTGNCDVQSPHGASVPPVTASGLHQGAVATASADAASYTGGFGGPPGVLKPYDDGKTGAPSASSKSHNGNSYGNTPNDAHSESVRGAANHVGGLEQSGHLGGSLAGSTAFSAASSSAGGYHNQGGVKGSSPCEGGCGGGDSNGSHGHAAAAAKSLSGASSFGFGGSFASSSASAHASSGAYTKGGYGRR